MKIQFLARASMFALLVSGLACAGNKASADESNDAARASRDSTAGMTDSAVANQTESGMTDSTGKSTLGPKAAKTRPDQGQPVTSKGDTVNPGVDSSTTSR